MLNNYLCALDISSSKIAAVAARIKGRRISNIYFEIAPCRALKKGAIVDSIELAHNIGRVLKKLKDSSGLNIKLVYASVTGQDICARHTQAIIPLAERGNKVITVSDIQKIDEQARILGSSLEEEILHQIPYSYAIDSKSNLLNPVGLYSHRLEVDAYMIYARLSSLQSLNRAVNQAGYELKDFFFSGLVTSEAVFNNELKEGTTVLCDIGSDTTEWLLFRGGALKHIEILFTGGDDLTLQLAEALKIPPELAEEIKRSYAVIGDYSHIGEDKEILVKKKDVYKPIKHRLVAEMITARARLVCEEIRNSVTRIVPADGIDNFVAVGRSVLLEGFLETLEASMGLPVKLGHIHHPAVVSLVSNNEILSGQKYLAFTTPLGIISHLLQEPQERLRRHGYLPAANPFLKAINKFKEIYQEYF